LFFTSLCTTYICSLLTFNSWMSHRLGLLEFSATPRLYPRLSFVTLDPGFLIFFNVYMQITFHKIDIQWCSIGRLVLIGVPFSLIYTFQVSSFRIFLVIVLPLSPPFRDNHFLFATNNSLISHHINPLPFLLQPLHYLIHFFYYHFH